jgi:hypothetical protein
MELEFGPDDEDWFFVARDEFVGQVRSGRRSAASSTSALAV